MIARSSRHTPNHIPHAIREPSVSRRWARFGGSTDHSRGVLFRAPSCRRASDTSSLRGLPGGALSAGVARRAPQWRPSGRTREPRPPTPLRVNARVVGLGPRRLLPLPRLRSDQRPGPLASPRPRVFRTQREEDAFEILQCHRPFGHVRVPPIPVCVPTSLARCCIVLDNTPRHCCPAILPLPMLQRAVRPPLAKPRDRRSLAVRMRTADGFPPTPHHTGGAHRAR